MAALAIGAQADAIDVVGLIEKALWIMLASAVTGFCLGLAAAGMLSAKKEGDETSSGGAKAGSNPE